MSKKQEFMTRGEVARLFDCSVSTIRRLEKKGELYPKLDKKGVHRFDKAEVDEYVYRKSIRTSSESLKAKQIRLEVRAIEMFHAGKDASEVMRKLRSMTCAEVLAILEFYRTAKSNPPPPRARASGGAAAVAVHGDEDDELDEEMSEEFRREFEKLSKR